MNGSRDKVRSALNHRNTGSVPVDFGATAVTGIHCRIVEAGIIMGWNPGR